MKEIIATIRLAGGQVGFYDKLTGIYLTQTQPVAHLYAGMNLNQIRKSLKSKRILLVSGSVDNSSLPILNKIKEKDEIEIKAKKKEVDTTTEKVESKTVAEEAKVEATIAEKPKAEAISEKQEEVEPVKEIESFAIKPVAEETEVVSSRRKKSAKKAKETESVKTEE